MLYKFVDVCTVTKVAEASWSLFLTKYDKVM